MMCDFRKYDLTSFRRDLEELEVHLTKEQEERFLSFYEILIYSSASNIHNRMYIKVTSSSKETLKVSLL